MAILPPLQDPSKQIRLLKPRPTAPGETLSFDISVWDLDKAPPYNAISYTWGDPDEPSEIPKLLHEEAEQVELVERLEKYLRPGDVTQEYHDEFGAWLDEIEPRRNLAHMELYAMFGRPLRRDSIRGGKDPDPNKKTYAYRRVENFDFSGIEVQIQEQMSELQSVKATIEALQAVDLPGIMVNDVWRPVQKNCCYVLKQATDHSPASRIWIDSVCIDQEDVNEKSSQVAMMFRIYERACRVLVGLGPAADQSERLFAITQSLLAIKQAFDGAKRHCHWPSDPSSIWKGIIRRLGDMEIAGIAAAFRALSQRPYWSRLWIVQEIAAAAVGNKTVYCMCGTSIVPKVAITWACKLLKADLSPLMDPYCVLQTIILSRDPHFSVYWSQEMAIESTLTMGKILDTSPSPMLDIDNVFNTYRGLRCMDRRDHVYGLLSLMDWNAMRVEPIIPDYSKTTIDLALEVRARGRHDWHTFDALMTALGIDSRSAALQALLHKQHEARSSSVTWSCSSQSDRAYEYPLYTDRTVKGLTECAILSDGRDDSLELSPNDDAASDVDHKAIQDFDDKMSGCPCEFRALKYNDSVIGLLCPKACGGDVLIPSWYHPHLALVLRPSIAMAGKLDVIGQAIIAFPLGLQRLALEPCETVGCSCSSPDKCKRFAAEVELRMSVADAFALEAQDYEEGSPCFIGSYCER